MKKMFFALTAFFFAGVASATTPVMDVSAVTGYLGGDVTTAVAAVGAALILLAVTAVGFKWIKGLIFS